MSSADYLRGLFGLDGLTAVVIGGTGTLGGAFCEALAQAGAFTFVVGRNREQGDARVRRIEELLEVPIALLSIGPEREKTLWLDRFFNE